MEIQYLCPLLAVFDMKAALQFYVEALGFSIHESAGPEDDVGWVWLERNGLNLMLNTQYELPDRPGQQEPARVAAHSDTILYLGCPDVDGAYHELLSKGLQINPPEIASYGMKQLYITDPDGYQVCLQSKV
ncbi:MAG: VOC family protein [Cytophagales bacterium]|nr:VOC family protein [Cytophagales bacterium]